MVGKEAQEAINQQAYRSFQAHEALLFSSIDYQSDYRKYVIRAYHYIRSRLLVPARCYEGGDFGPISIGGPAHCDIMDLEVWIAKQSSPRLSRDVLEWMNDSSPEEVAHTRGMVRIPIYTHMQRRRRSIARDFDSDSESGHKMVETANIQV